MMTVRRIGRILFMIPTCFGIMPVSFSHPTCTWIDPRIDFETREV